jgi:hypothetical protein
MMGKVPKASNSECYTPSAEPFRTFRYWVLRSPGEKGSDKKKENRLMKYIT